MAALQSATKAAYDPVKAVEGTFNGSVTRIAYVLKDPINYGGSTKTVLAICAKRFQDALDDCEVQLLDSKWYLERQLRENRLRREARAREMGTAAKRKHDEMKEANDPSTSDQTVIKKAKTEHDNEKVAPGEPAKPKDVTEPATSTPKPLPNPASEPDVDREADKTEEQNKETQTQPAASESEEPSKLPAKEEPQPTQVPEPPPQDDFAKPTPPQATPTGTNDDFNFESVFGEPTGGEEVDGDKDNNDLGFDFTTGDLTGGVTDTTTNVNDPDQDQTSLDTFLPGLATYANQTDENALTVGNGINTGDKNPTTNNNANQQDVSTLPSFPTDFDLPDIGGPNVFDDFLNDDSLDTGGNFDSQDPNDTSLLDDFDFDSMF